MLSVPSLAAPERRLPVFPSLPASITNVFGSMTRAAAHLSMPAELQLKVAFGQLKLDLSEAVFSNVPMLLVCESLCASVEVRLPGGVTVADDSVALLSSYKLGHTADGSGPVIHVEGWSVCSKVKFVSGSAPLSVELESRVAV